MSIKAMMLAAAAVATLAVPAAASAHDYHGYGRGDYGHSYGYRHDGGYGYRGGYGYGYRGGYERDWRARWDGPARYRDHDGWRGYGWRYGDHGRYGDRD